MKIELIGEAIYRVIKIKFIALSNKSGDVFIRVYESTEKYHSELVRETNEECHVMQLRNFVGAGYYYPHEQTAKWDSISCKRVFRRDEPEDDKLGDKILREIEEFCKAHSK
jgi:hypothetical protein